MTWAKASAPGGGLVAAGLPPTFDKILVYAKRLTYRRLPGWARRQTGGVLGAQVAAHSERGQCGAAFTYGGWRERSQSRFSRTCVIGWSARLRAGD